MKETVIVVIAIVALSLIIASITQSKQNGVWINCGLSEISPDFTNEMREACRQARSQYDSGFKQRSR